MTFAAQSLAKMGAGTGTQFRSPGGLPAPLAPPQGLSVLLVDEDANAAEEQNELHEDPKET